MKKKIQNDKGQFFALHLGCMVEYPAIGHEEKPEVNRLTQAGFRELSLDYKRKRQGCIGDDIAFSYNGNHNCNALNAKLLMTMPDSISDDDAIELYDLFSTKYLTTTPNFIKLGYSEESIRSFKIIKGHVIIDCHADGSDIVDFMRSKFYAMPWLGHSVSKMIKLGWIKIVSK